MSYTYEQLEHFAGCVNLILGGKRQTIEEMVRKISELKANKDYYTEWDALSQDVEDLAEYAGVDISDCESPNKVCALVLFEMKKRLMPDGCEWPRFDDGLQVHLGDEFVHERQKREVMGIEFDSEGYSIHDRGGCYIPYGRRQRVEKVEPDTWELWTLDLCRPPVSYCAKRGLDGSMPAAAKADDLVRRAKKLVGVE